MTVMLFKDVKNAAEIHAKLLERTLEPEMALLNPAPVHSVFALHVAAHKALVDAARDRLTTRTIHSEIVYNMSASKHITEGLRRFGMAEDAAAVLACRFDASPEDVAAMRAAVRGVAADGATLEADLEALADAAKVKKYYRPGELEVAEGVGTIEDAVVVRIGAREAL